MTKRTIFLSFQSTGKVKLAKVSAAAAAPALAKKASSKKIAAADGTRQQ